MRNSRGSLYADAALLGLCRETGLRKVPFVLEYLCADGLVGREEPVPTVPHKFIIFFHHRTVGDAYREWMVSRGVSFIYIDGTMPQAKRSACINRFRDEAGCRVALLSLCATSTGLNLQFCSIVICVELTFHSVHHTQSEARVYRIGQTQPVHIRYLLLKGTTDDMLWSSLNGKQSTEHTLFRDCGDTSVAASSTKANAPRQTKMLDGTDDCGGDIIVPLD